ncbi:MAG: zinc-binding alcohol dehydrogenase family protein [Opitutae bacterium]|jgi:2-desacetyl-2-hydroxyethyl bacteriochlorophyllide A dehydrogenase|nr:zinc-binding alcohol dehydrogenase family protein [Opitutae bacterium]MBT5715777.1 zinc-binding alcohol dehydrogenase family protein [Opitutae bacterium]
MKAIRLVAPQKFEQIEIEEPEKPGRGEALIRTIQMGICGTDVSCYLGKFPFFDYPRIPGHELGVEVLEVGEGVNNVNPGDRCSLEPYFNCGECHPCKKGYGNCCENLKVFGVMMNGGLCERSIVRADKLHPSKELSFEQLALVETLAIGCHASDRGNPQKGDHALIIGTGPIGLSALEFNRLTGATITVMDMSVERLEFCRKNYGVENLILFKGDGSEIEQMREITNGGFFDVVTDATGNHHSMSNALEFVAYGGSLVYVGITTQEISFTHPALHRREIDLLASRNALPKDFPRILRLIEDGTINTAPWITHRITMAQVKEKFESLIIPESGVLKAMIEVSPQ